MDKISPNFIYALILTRSSLGLLRVFFCTLILYYTRGDPEIRGKVLYNFCSLSNPFDSYEI